MNILIIANICLSWITIFRFLMYTFALKMNTKNKISENAWKYAGIREVSYEWTMALRMLFGFRLLATFAVCYAADVNTNWIFILITLLFNSYFVLFLFGVTGPGIDKGTIVKPEKTFVPKLLTVLDFLGPLLFVIYYLFFQT